jgi:hypothetical protein
MGVRHRSAVPDTAFRLFTVDDRDAVRDRVLELAASDERIVAGAAVGSLALGGGDRWSDLDLTFGVADDASVDGVLADWTSRVVGEFDAVHLFDLPSGPTVYRVFLLPGGLQVDLSFTPASQFGAGGPRFRLLFGDAVEKPQPEPPSAQDLFGWAVAYARDARASIERGRRWQAEYCISAVRDHALTLACLERGLPTRYGRGFDDLPAEVRAAFDDALVSSLEREALLAALRCAVDGLLREAGRLVDIVARVEPSVRTLLAHQT